VERSEEKHTLTSTKEKRGMLRLPHRYLRNEKMKIPELLLSLW
jgi:hypothetical protein